MVTALRKRHQAYEELHKRFGGFRILKTERPDAIQEKSKILLQAYPQDLEEELLNEMAHLSQILKSPMAEFVGKNEDTSLEADFYRLIIDNSL